MPTWRVAALSAEPEIRLIDWRIMETDRNERHFIGARLDDGSGRVSTAIVEFDPDGMIGVSQSGRVYRLVGPPGWNENADYVWSAWRAVNRVACYADVTDSALRRPGENVPAQPLPRS
jgi:hypothetical protein